jgi:amino acid adenylation domain-containing protein
MTDTSSNLAPAPSAGIASRFIAIAEAYPTRPALVIDGTVSSYGELLGTARRIAGVCAEMPSSPFLVGLGDRRLGQYSALFAAAMAGRTFVPVYAPDPAEGHIDVLRRTEANVVVIDQAAEAALPAILDGVAHPLCVIALHTDTPPVPFPARHTFVGAAAIRRARPVDQHRVGEHEGAYLFFTSGSTGKPKGVLVTHRNLLRFVDSAVFRLAPGADDRFMQLSKLSWDLSILETLVPWSAGSCVYRVPDSLLQLVRFVRDNELTFWVATPSVGHTIADLHQLTPGAMPSLRSSVFCGEAPSARLFGLWREAAPDSIIENFYGPTEAAVSISGYRWSGRGMPPDPVPMGEAFPGQRIEARDLDGRPVRDGEIGEAYLAGDQVVSGYWLDPEQTDRRFLRDADGVIWYRTGDLVQRSEHGWLFRGRVDDQMKIQGYRIERQEVESYLRRVAGCSAVAVLALPLRDGSSVLTIHAVIENSAKSASEILAGCRSLMPSHMVPTAVHLLPLPRNQNGKIDYRRLAANIRTAGAPAPECAGQDGRIR